MFQKSDLSSAQALFFFFQAQWFTNLVYMAIVHRDVDGISIPVLQNTTQVAEHTLLLQASKDLASKMAAPVPPVKRQRSKAAGQWSIWAILSQVTQ